MNNNELILLDTDRIVEINGFKLFVHDNLNFNRRNVTCHSNILEKYITLNKLSNKNPKHTIKIGELICNKIINDIKVVKVNGYY